MIEKQNTPMTPDETALKAIIHSKAGIMMILAAQDPQTYKLVLAAVSQVSRTEKITLADHYEHEAELEALEAEYISWRKLEYNASQIGNAKRFGYCKFQVERLEKEIDALEAEMESQEVI